jgi:hypothetical protein
MESSSAVRVIEQKVEASAHSGTGADGGRVHSASSNGKTASANAVKSA